MEHAAREHHHLWTPQPKWLHVMSTSWTLRGGSIIDGTGEARFVGDVVIEGDRIASIGDRASSGTIVDVAGLVVAPGFVDIHSHDDWILPLADGPVLVAPNVQQGITTVVTGNCGISPAPLGDEFHRGSIERLPVASYVSHLIGWNWRTVGEYFDEIEKRNLPLNLCMLVGHSTLRATVMGGDQRPPTMSELAEMQRMLEDGIRDGALGLSVGLEYFPGRYAGTTEVADLAAIVSRHDALLAAHTRGISTLYEQSVAEAIEVAERSRCRLQISHVNPMGRANWESIDRLFALVDSTRAHGLDVGYDIVTYNAWTVSALELLPHFVMDYGVDAILALAADVDGRARLKALIEGARPQWPPWIGNSVTRNIPLEMGWENLILADPASAMFSDGRGETLGTLSRGKDPYDVYFDLLTASRGEARIINVGYGGDFEDDTPLRRLVSRPDAIPETDTVLVQIAGQGLRLTLPLFFGTMARFLGHFSRDLGLLPLEQAVHRITQLPANRVQLAERGVLREGAYADVTVFDPETVSDRGTYLAPQPAGGIEHVFVNGQPVVRNGEYDAEVGAGRALRRGI